MVRPTPAPSPSSTVVSSITAPLLLAPEALRAAWLKGIPEDKVSFLAMAAGSAKRNRATAAGVGAFDVLVLAPEAIPAAFFATKTGGFIVRALTGGASVLATVDGESSVKKWKEVGANYEAKGDVHALFSTATEYVPVLVADGVYSVERGAATKGGSKLEVIRLTRTGDRKRKTVDTETVVELSRAERLACHKMMWASSSGGVMVLIPAEKRPGWSSVEMRPVKKPTLRMEGSTQALLLPDEDAVAFWSRPDGGLLFSGQLGDNGDCAAAALSVPEGRWKPLGIVVKTDESGKMAYFDGSCDGDDAEVGVADLAPGSYAVDAAGGFQTEAATLGWVLRLRKVLRRFRE